MKVFIRENWFKLVISFVLILVAVSAAYYLIVFLPEKQNEQEEQWQRFSQNIISQQQSKIDELQRVKEDQDARDIADKAIISQPPAEQESEKSNVPCLSYGNFSTSKQTGILSYSTSTKNMSAVECNLIKQKNESTKQAMDKYDSTYKTIAEKEDECIKKDDFSQCLNNILEQKTKLLIDTLSKLNGIWGESATYK